MVTEVENPITRPINYNKQGIGSTEGCSSLKVNPYTPDNI